MTDFITTTIDMIRHGEPAGGKKYRGQIDDPLSETGWRQMREAVGDHCPWDLIVTFLRLHTCLYWALAYIFRVPTPDLIVRTLLPAHIAILLGLLCLILFFIQTWSSHKWLVLFPIFLILGFSISYLHDTQDIISIYHQSGFGYTSRDWRNSETIRPSNTSPQIFPSFQTNLLWCYSTLGDPRMI